VPASNLHRFHFHSFRAKERSNHAFPATQEYHEHVLCTDREWYLPRFHRDCFVWLISGRRRGLGLTQAQVADACGHTQQWLSNIEGKDLKRCPPYSTLQRLAAVLRLPIYDVLDSAGYDHTGGISKGLNIALVRSTAECRDEDVPEIEDVQLPATWRHVPGCAKAEIAVVTAVAR
jgi:transcriptional regulator with XRE-family HTH domain